MKYVKIMMLAIILAVLLVIGAASAADVDANDTAILSAGENDEIVSVENDLDVLSEDQYTYSELRDKIGSGGNISLAKGTYTYSQNDGDTIQITDSGVIDGNGAVIDMAGFNKQAFIVETSGVTIKNLTIKNANFTGNGGAICFEGDGAVENCSFTNNQATWGGAIYFVDESTGTVEKCNFANNQVTGDPSGGGAIWMGSGNVANCNFTNNQATGYSCWAGAIEFSGTGDVICCNFDNNQVTGYSSEGGAIWMGSGNVANCNFTNNQAIGELCNGGAVYLCGDGTVTGCNFTNNRISDNEGGAIYIISGNVANCNFANNFATAGGAIFFGGDGTVTGCNFTGNNAGGGSAIYFISEGTVTGCNFDNNQASGSGGAVLFQYCGTVTDCNFTNNFAISGGAICFLSNDTGTVENCSFTNNVASHSGAAICFVGEGTVTDCNFDNNSAPSGGAICFCDDGAVENCSFTNNQATEGGAILMFSGNVTNCNFTGNNAGTGSAIYLENTSSTVKNSCFLNNRADAEALEVTKSDNNIIITFTGNDNLLNAIYSKEDVSFTNVTYWSAKGIANTDTFAPVRSNKEAGQNITVSVVVNDALVLSGVKVTDVNGMIVLGISAGESYFIGVRHDADSYYTEAEETLSNNTKFNVNVTSKTSNNRAVNITANSNIPNEIINGNLLFILPNGEEINATYAGSGIWWAVHAFDNYTEYEVTASFIGLGNVTVNNATITIINKANSTIALEDIAMNYGDSKDVTVTTQGAVAITAKIDDKDVAVVNNYTIPISGLDAGNHTLSVTTIPDEDHVSANKTVSITVNKANSTLTVDNIVFDYNATGSGEVSFTGATGIDASVANHPEAIVNVTGNTITVSGLDVGTYTLSATTIPDANHNAVTGTASVTVNRIKTLITADGITTTYNVNKDLVITLKDGQNNSLGGVSVTVDLNGAKNYTTDENGQVVIATASLVPNRYAAEITFKGDEKYAESSATADVVVKKATPSLTAKSKAFKDTDKAKKYAVVLKDNTGKPIKNVKVYVKVNGRVYSAVTDGNGKAVFKLTKLTKKGTYSALVVYKQSKCYNKVSKKVKIAVKTTFKTIGPGCKDKAAVKKVQKALKNKGYYLTYKGHYLMIDGYYGSCTQRSVKEFQSANGLKVTGSVDYKTAKKLGIVK